MIYDFIEIGTSDFDTEIQKPDNRIGISIEPVKYYLEKLPNKPGCIKLNMGVSDHDGKTSVYYIPDEILTKHNLPWWLRGCNSINSYHPTVVSECKRRNITPSDVIHSYEIEICPLISILSKYNVSGIMYLKIDTEGHDTVILSKFFDDITNNSQLPHCIVFESNVLSRMEDVKRIIAMYNTLGYDLIKNDGNDTELRLNLQSLKGKTHFTPALDKYYIMNYPVNYDINNLPHDNTLESAKEYCVKHNCAGVTLQDGIYQVRRGPYVYYYEPGNVQSWVYI